MQVFELFQFVKKLIAYGLTALYLSFSFGIEQATC